MRPIHPPLVKNQTQILHGADYNPEQWGPDTWAQDHELMGDVHFTSATLGVFSWVSLEPEPGKFVFDWLDYALDKQAEHGRNVFLATPTAAPPAWMSKQDPEILRTGADGVRKRHGNRVNFCWSSPKYKDHVARIDNALAHRYKDHPALALWHVSNEYCEPCFCGLCQTKFQGWLQSRYGSLDALNAAYWTAFWSHTFTSWDQIEIPGSPHGETSIFGLTLDWRRFCSDQIIEFYKFEASILRGVAPGVPLTTNLMGFYPGVDPFKLADELDIVSWDSYPFFAGEPSEINAWAHAAMSHDMNRSVKGKPFLLMEYSPSSSNWYKNMALKRPGAHEMEGIQAVSHGADGVCYFQWRQSRGSSEMSHGAVVPHNGRTDVKVYQDVKGLGKRLTQLSPVIGAAVPAKIALIHDWEVKWSIDTQIGYRTDKADLTKTVLAHYRPLWQAGLETDVIDSTRDLSNYKLVIAPTLSLLREGVAERLVAYVRAGGNLVLTYRSGWVDENGLAFANGAPGPLTELLGFWSEEIDELYPHETNTILPSEDAPSWLRSTYGASVFCERIHPETAEVVATYGQQFYAGEAALTKNSLGEGTAWYVASKNDEHFQRDFLVGLSQSLGIEPPIHGTWDEGVSVRRRSAAEADYLFILNCTNRATSVDLETHEALLMLDGAKAESQFVLEPFGYKILVRPL